MMISIITPVFNEEDYVGPFLAHLNTLDGEFELILVDGGSTDNTLSRIEELRTDFRHGFHLLEARRGRGNQMNSGAKRARGDILFFLHVDSRIMKGTLGVILEELEDATVIGGGLTQRFDDPHMFLTLMSLAGNFRTRTTGIFYGDYGFFIRREVFETMGGYDDIPFLEDVEICRRAKKFGRLKQIDCRIWTSSRRFRSKGKLRLSVAFALALLMNALGLRPQFLRKYIVDK